MGILDKASNTIHLLTVAAFNERLNENQDELINEKNNLVRENEMIIRVLKKSIQY